MAQIELLRDRIARLVAASPAREESAPPFRSDTTPAPSCFEGIASSTDAPLVPEQMLDKWQKIVDVMARIVGVPSGLIMKVDTARNEIAVCIASQTEGNPYKREEAFALIRELYCDHVMSTRRPLLVPHGAHDAKWVDSPDVKIGLPSYLGFPLEWPDGSVFGTICVLDSKENHYNENYKDLLAEFKSTVDSDLRLLIETRALSDLNHDLGSAVAEGDETLRLANAQLERDLFALKTALRDLESSEERLRKLNGELEQRVLDRTAELEVTVEELKAFSYTVSHDLRAPVRAVSTFAEALLEDAARQLDEEALGNVRHIRGAASEMAQMIEDLLKLSQVSRAELKREQVDLSSLAGDVLRDLRISERQREVEIRVEEGLTAMGDAGLLRIVLANLLGNAWKFTSRRSDARIELGTEQDERGRSIYFVRDNGAGFDAKYKDKLFNCFQRLHSSSEFEGTGIGLATVRRIIRRHGGDVWVEGEVGRGATVRFAL